MSGDFLNRTLEVGDSVIFIRPGESKGLLLGRVAKLNPKTVRIEYRVKNHWRNENQSAQRAYSEVVKVDGPDLTMFLLTKD